MVSKNENQKLQETFEFVLTHTDIIDMMNDPDVELDDADVSEEQVLEIVVQKANGSQIYLREFKPTDKVLFRFVRVTDTDGTTQFSGVDVE